MNRSIIAATVRATGLAIVAIIGVAVTSPSMAGDHLAQAGAKGAVTGSVIIHGDNRGEIIINNHIQLIAKETSVPLEALRNILESMGEKALAEAAPAKIEQLLRAKAKEFLSLEQELRILKGDDDPEVQRLQEAARQALREGRLQDVKELLRQAEERVHAVGETAYSTWQASRKREAELVFARASAARLQVNPTAYREAAELFGKAARLVADDVRKARNYQLRQASVLDDLGGEFGDNDALREAIALYRQILSGIDRATDPLDWAATQNNLGIALRKLGERKGDKKLLNEAVAAYRAALEERTRERVPLGWATTQNNLGTALQTLGKRESDTKLLNEAVAAYRAALEETPRERVPLDWAMTQNNLGAALSMLGEQEGGKVKVGTAYLNDAVAAYRAALEEYTRERVPLDWAMTQNNLGNALKTLGERESGTVRLNEAVAAYRAALEEYTRERVPFYWAMTQNNLGGALRTLGKREGDKKLLNEAVAAYQAALQEYTRERVPLYWAGTQNNLGNVLQTLDKREGDKKLLAEAIAAYRAALEERTRERVPLDWAVTQNNLGNALKTLGEREGDMARLHEAVAAYRAAFSVFKASGVSSYAEIAKRNLALSEAALDRARTGSNNTDEIPD